MTACFSELLTVQTLAALGLGGAALLHDALARRTLQAALAAAGVLARLAGELHRPLGLGRQHQRHLSQ